jgi:hypothetical protein
MMEDDSVRFWQEWQNQFEQELLELEAEIKAEKVLQCKLNNGLQSPIKTAFLKE